MISRFQRQILAGICFALAACSASPPGVTTSTAATTQQAGLVDIESLIPDAALDIRYAGQNNFVGAPIDGYEASKCFLLRPVAEALARVERELREENLRLRIFDCYRPVRAVQHFVRWAHDLDDQRTRADYYPNLDKRELLGVYIARVSGHSRGATVDLTLSSCNENGRDCRPLDMGTPFDFFDERAHTDTSHVSPEQRANRHRLREAMSRQGFENYAAEWWHYTYRPEPSPNAAFDVPIR